MNSDGVARDQQQHARDRQHAIDKVKGWQARQLDDDDEFTQVDTL